MWQHWEIFSRGIWGTDKNNSQPIPDLSDEIIRDISKISLKYVETQKKQLQKTSADVQEDAKWPISFSVQKCHKLSFAIYLFKKILK